MAMKSEKIRKLVTMAMLAALSIVLVYVVHFPIFPAAPFLEYDPADIPILIGTFAYGPVAGIILTVVVSVIQGMTVSASSGFMGIAMHIFATSILVLVAGNIYRLKHTKKGAVIALICGVAAMTAGMVVFNYFITPYFITPDIADAAAVAANRDFVKTLLVPVIILGGIYGSIFTPTEAAAVSVVYGLVVGVFIYREVKMKDMIDILVDSGKTTGGIMLIIGAATLFSYVCTVFGIAQAAQALLLEISGNKYIFLLIVNVIFLIAGCFVDANSAMYIFIPIMYPVATQLGIDPVHFGVIATVNLAIGQVTPPVGVNLFVAIGVSEKLQGLRDKPKVTIVSMSKAVWPQIVACIIALLLITYVPWFSTVLLFGK